jgi:hypothetical protein
MAFCGDGASSFVLLLSPLSSLLSPHSYVVLPCLIMSKKPPKKDVVELRLDR